MNQQEVFNRISGILKELNDQYNYLRDDPSKINELELELFVANAHFLANHADLLKKINLQQHQQQHVLPPVVQAPVAVTVTPRPTEPPTPTGGEVAPSKGEKYFEPVVQDAVLADDSPAPQIDLSGETPADDYSYIRQSEPEVIKHELEIDDSWIEAEEEEDEPILIPEPKVEPKYESAPSPASPLPKKPVEMEKQPEPIVEKAAPQPSKKEEQEVLTINQRLSAQITHKHETVLAPIADLRSAITLNDKLLFVKDLFNGYSLAYSEAIDILNRFNSFDEADKYLKTTYSAKNHWDNKPQTVEKFYGLLSRRFA